MNEEDFARIESQLGIRLPDEYRRVMASEGRVLIDLALECNRELDYLEMVFLDVEHVIRYNLVNREEDYGTVDEFPDWWQTFFMVGTNGAGDYYSLYLDGRPGVWLIGSDCGGEPTLKRASFAELVEKKQADFREEMRDPERAIPVPAISQDDWEALKRALPTVTDLGDSYRSFWERDRERAARMRAEGWNTMDVYVRAPAFLAWCEARQLPGDAMSREAYAAERWPIENPWIGTYQAGLRATEGKGDR